MLAIAASSLGVHRETDTMNGNRRRGPTHLRTAFVAFGAAVALQVGPLWASEPVQEEDEFAGLETHDLRAGDDEKKHYFLIQREGIQAPSSGFKLLVVLPGGDGSADSLAFVKRIHENALTEAYLIAQLVAPAWSDDQMESVVWPTKKSPWPKMKFSTEEFINAVVADIEEHRAVDPNYIFTLAWSSGGPAAYAYSVHKETRATGSFIAMSVFKPGQMESLKNAEGQGYFLLHSPEDFIPMDHPEQAEKALTKKKAKVKLVTYPGGHGWIGDVYGNMRQGISFLEGNHAKPKKVPKKK